MSKSAFPRLHKAIKLAVKGHNKQDRDGESALPYVTHPVDVLSLVRYEAGVTDEDVLCAAVLHDTLEETDLKADKIEDKFGDRVAELVKELTREEPDEATMQLPEDEVWKIRDGMMMAEIDRMSHDAKVIKLADRCSNLRNAFKSKSGAKLARYIDQSRRILEHIDREVSPPLWDCINQMVEDGGGQKAKRKNLQTNGAHTPSIAG